MSRHAFWTIIVGGTPTAFRAPLREDLQPTLVQLQRTQPDAVIRWFEKGQLWETPGHAQDAAKARQQADRPRRSASWRPGGDHKDPRDKYKVPRDVKRKRWASQAADGRGPWAKKRSGGSEDKRTGGQHRPTGTAGRRPRQDKPPIPGRTPNARAAGRPETPPPPPRPTTKRAPNVFKAGEKPPAARKKRDDE